MAKGGPDLKRYMDKTLSLKLNGNRTVKVCGITAVFFAREKKSNPEKLLQSVHTFCIPATCTALHVVADQS